MKNRHKEPANFNYCPMNFTDRETSNGVQEGQWRSEVSSNEIGGLQEIPQLGSNNFSRDAKTVREDFLNFFNSPQGEVPWQYEVVTRTH